MVSWPTVATAAWGMRMPRLWPRGSRRRANIPGTRAAFWSLPVRTLKVRLPGALMGKISAMGIWVSNFTAGTLTWAVSPIFTWSR